MALLQVEQSPGLRAARRLCLLAITSVAVVIYMMLLVVIIIVLFPLAFFQKTPTETEEDRFVDW